MKVTSLHAWYQTIKPTLKTRKAQIMAIIKEQGTGITMRDVAATMKVPTHTISGRFGELENNGEIRTEGTTKYDDSDQPHNLYFPC